jgi:HAD superfamily hydrolase (TIGR01509 family)
VPLTPRPAAVLWDLDGTLVDTEPYWIASERDVVARHGNGDWPDHHAHAIVGADLIDAATYIAEHGEVRLAPPEIVELLLDGVVARIRERIPWRPGAVELLRALHSEGVPTALVTMSWRRFVDPVLEQLPPGAFGTIVTGDEVERGKPHPMPYLVAAERLGVDPAECIAIEDSPTGVTSALRAGCRVIGVPNVRTLEPAEGLTIVGTLDGLDVDGLVAAALTGAPPRRRGQGTGDRRTLGAVIAVAALAVAGAVAWSSLGGDGEAARPPVDQALDTWAPYWTLDDTLPGLEDRLDTMREVSPFFYRTTGVTEIGLDPNAPADAVDEFLEVARDADVAVVPSVLDATPAGVMAGILADPATRRAHVEALVEFVEDGDFDGIDIDYEQFAFADGRETWEATRPNWVAFVAELADELHGRDKTVTVSIPPVYDATETGDRGYWVYDHGAIAEHVDRIRIMAYDYSTAEPGPIAPLWWVQQSVDGVLSVVDDPGKVVLGIPTYGYNWPTTTVGACPPDAQGRTGVTARSVHELLELRGGTPVRDDAIGEWSFEYPLVVSDGTTSCTQTRFVQWVDGDGAAERIEIARRAGLGGVSLWALGYEDDDVWATIESARATGPAGDGS